MTEPTIIYEDPRFAIIEKPAGWLVHAVSQSETSGKRKARGVKREAESEIGSKRKEKSVKGEAKSDQMNVALCATPYDLRAPTLTDWLLVRYPEIATVGDDPRLRPGIVHRLDREVSGVMIVARTQEFFLYAKSLFQNHLVKKFYYAAVVGEMERTHGIIDAAIGMKKSSLKRSVFSAKNAKEALTEYEVMHVFTVRRDALILPRGKKKFEDEVCGTMLRVQTHSGRTHQIRIHLQSIHHPIFGDALYGNATARMIQGRIYLHAYRVEFPIEAGRVMRFETEMPAEFISLTQSA